ncbi:MAG: hypothetical protein AMXMBFR84_36990 [Candidatus Hydrogenedentota bacterium]
MHVDTHGGYLNLVTHHREAVIVASPTENRRIEVCNADATYDPVAFDMDDSCVPKGHRWYSFITSDEIRQRLAERPGFWGHYLEGAALRMQYGQPERPIRGMRAVAASDIPCGAGLSSSTALVLATLGALMHVNEVVWSPSETILAARDSEWYAGARIGVSDQAAMVLGGRNRLYHAALYAEARSADSHEEPALEIRNSRHCELPGDMAILVVNSRTRRHLSGAALVEYTQNRFAYSMALEILRQEMTRAGVDAEIANRYNRLSAFDVDGLGMIGGISKLYSLLTAVPRYISVSQLECKYHLPRLNGLYMQAFGMLPEQSRPTNINLRGPLLFGIAESERARLFFGAAANRDWTAAGQWMSLGHDGDRRYDSLGLPWNWDCTDSLMEALQQNATPLATCPGRYGASSRFLDGLVDAAMEAGALGACLTGAGIAGSVIALVRAQEVNTVADCLRRTMASTEYAAWCGGQVPLETADLADSVVVNHATEGLCALQVP